jgi:hypothetical protein
LTAKQGNRGNGDPFSEIIENSGNTFHAKVAHRFREAGWQVLVSPYYVDNATDKPREVDLICERLWIATPQWNTEPPRLFRIQLIVECKYIPNNSATVFWFDGTNQAKVDELIISRLPFFQESTGIQLHHYKTASPLGVAKLFQSRSASGVQNEEREPIYMALNQCVGALIGLGNLQPLTSPPRWRTFRDEHLVRYPVVVCSTFDRFRRTSMMGGPPETIDDSFLMELNYAWRNTAGASIRQFALVDIVAFEMLDQFLHALSREAAAAEQLLIAS